MSKRWLICIVLSLIGAGIFLFVPAFNWGGIPHVSLYQQYATQGEYWYLVKRAGLLTLIVFVSLLFMIVFKR